MFSYIMSKFIEMMNFFNETGKDIEEKSDLTLFFNTLTYFNQKKEFDPKFKEKIEQYFDYRWKNDKNVGFEDDKDQLLIRCLPGLTKD